MNKYVFVGTEKDLIDNGFTYRKHYDNYLTQNSIENYVSCQDLCVQIDHKTKDVDIYIQCLNGHRNQSFMKEGMYVIQADIYPTYFETIKSLIEKGIIKEVEDDNSNETLKKEKQL